jgi:hypothetical protein
MSTFTRWLSLEEADAPLSPKLNGYGSLYAFVRLSLPSIVLIDPAVHTLNALRGVDK